MAYLNFQNCTKQEYETALYSQDANNKIKILFNNVEFTDADLYCEKLTVKPRIIANGSKQFSLNNFVSKEVELILHDINLNIIQDQVSISIGTLVNNTYEYVPIGIFNIENQPTTDKNKTTIKLRDNAIKFDFYYNAQPLIENNGGSVTKLQILQDICTQAGVTCNITSFIGYLDEIGIYDNTITGREYIANIAEQAGKIATINRNGELIFVDLNNLTTWEIPIEIVEKYESGTKFKIGKVVYEDGIVRYETEDSNDDTLFLDSSNPYINNDLIIEQVASNDNTYILEDDNANLLTKLEIEGKTLLDDFYNNYVPVEYIATNQHGNYINTGFQPTYDTKIEIKYMTISNFSQNPRPNYCAVAGSYNTSLNAGISIASTVNSTGVSARFDGQTYNVPINDDNVELIDINSKDGYYRNGTKLKTWSNTTQFTLNQYITIFTATINANNGVTTWQRNIRVYYCKIYENNELVRDMIPCYRKSDNVIGFYDLVNGNFYINQGEGVFAAGSAITIPTFDYPINLESVGVYDSETNKYDIIVTTSNDGNEDEVTYLLESPLCSIGDIKDKMYIKNNKLYVERKIGSIKFNGSESWGLIYNDGKHAFVRSLRDGIGRNALCNYYIANTSGLFPGLGEFAYLGDGNKNIYFRTPDETNITNTTQWKNWLSTHNVEIQYLLETPIIEELGETTLPSLYEGTTYIDIDSNINTKTSIQYSKSMTHLEAILNEVNLFNIDSLTTGKILGNPAIDGYDLIQIVDGQKTLKTLATSNLVYNGVLINTFDTQIEEEAKDQNVTINGEDTFKKWARTKIDNVEGTLTLQAGEINEANNKINTTTLQLTTQGALLEVIANNSNIDIAYDNDGNPQSGEVREVTTTTGFTFNADGMSIKKDEFEILQTPQGAYYKEGNNIVGQYTKDGSKQKDLHLFGVYYYGMKNKDDTPMFVAQLYNDESNEECFGHFYNRGD